MKVAELVAYLQALEQGAEVLAADYYYDQLEGYDILTISDVRQCFKPASESTYYKHKGSAVLINTKGVY